MFNTLNVITLYPEPSLVFPHPTLHVIFFVVLLIVINLNSLANLC